MPSRTSCSELLNAPARPEGDPAPGQLSERERQIVIGLCDGLSRDDVARRIGRSRSTLDKAISLIYTATGFRDAYQLVAWGFRSGLYAAHRPDARQGGAR